MLRAAAGDDPRFVVDDRELRRPGPSYTVLTLEEMRAERGAQPIVLIMGMDAYRGHRTLASRRELASLAHLVIALRPKPASRATVSPRSSCASGAATDPASSRRRPPASSS